MAGFFIVQIMPDYFTRKPKADYLDDTPFLPNLTVYESGDKNTGLLDANGNEIWRMSGIKLGFDLTKREAPMGKKRKGGGTKKC
jgi:hypothetical protein